MDSAGSEAGCWRKAQASAGNGACVELREDEPGLRDSKTGATLDGLTADQVREFVLAAKAGLLDDLPG